MLKSHWQNKHGMTLWQRMCLAQEQAAERIIANQERAMFEAIERTPKLLAELDEQRRMYIADVEDRILKGWVPDGSSWAAIELNLAVFARRRDEIEYAGMSPEAIKALKTIKLHEERKAERPSVFDRYASTRFRY